MVLEFPLVLIPLVFGLFLVPLFGDIVFWFWCIYCCRSVLFVGLAALFWCIFLIIM
jgi:hypothetical protein